MMLPGKSHLKSIGIILLAAGESARLGVPKQLLSYNGQTFLQNSLQAAFASDANPIVVVLGAHADKLERELEGYEVHIAVNAGWAEGMASSIRYGVQTLIRLSPSIEGAILMVCDQPYVTTSILNDLIAAHHNNGHPIVACSYADTVGPPTLFHRSIFRELLLLQGDVGAKSILHQHSSEVDVIFFPEGNLDIDTESDYQRLSEGRCDR